MKKPAIYILLVTGLFIGVAYIAINKVAQQKKAKEEIARQQEEEQKKQQRKFKIAKIQQQLIVYKRLLDDTKVELSVAVDNLNSMMGFQFIRTPENESQQLKAQYQKIEKLEILLDSTLSKIGQLKEKIVQIQYNEE